MNKIIKDQVEDGIQIYIKEYMQRQHTEDLLPPELKEKHDQHIDNWRKDEEKFIETEASKNVEERLRKDKCVLVVGRSGNGKSSIIRHLALSIQAEMSYQIMPTVKSPSDILAFNDQKRNQIFIIDDLLGKDMINAQAVDEWSAEIDKVLMLLNTDSRCKTEKEPDGNVKFLFATGVDFYNDSMFHRLNPIKKYACDISNWPLNDQEKLAMIRNYISPESESKLTKKLNSDEAYFPLLCKIAEGRTAEHIIRLFSNLNDFIKQDLLALKETNHLKFCIITLCAILNNNFVEDLLTDGYDFDTERKIFENICMEFNLGSQKEPVKNKIREQLKNLEGMYLAKTENYYHFIHSKVYRTAVLVCGQAFLHNFIKFGRSSYIAERFCFKSSITDRNQDSVIIIDDENTEKRYFDRLMADLEQGVTYSAFHNSQLRHKSYRDKFCLYCQNRKQKVSELLKHFNAYSETLTKNVSFENKEDYEDYIDFKNQHHFSSHKMRKPLIESAWEGYADIIQMLLDSGCNINEIDKFGRTALFVACFCGNDDVVDVLLRNNANHSLYDQIGQSPLFVASREGYHKIVQVLIQKSADLNLCNVNGDSPLLIASSEGHLWTVQTLLREVQDFSKCNNLGQTPVFLASMNGRTDVLKYLFSSHFSEYISKFDNEGRSPLFIACMGGHHTVVQFLLENHADISQCDWSKRSPLFIASAEGHAKIVKLLVQNNANINHCDEEGMTPLFIAAEKGRTEIASFLIDSGANINITDNKRRSPFYAACRRGFISIVQLLHEHNARTSDCNKWGGSALFAACREGHVDIAKFLIHIGANISTPDCNGTTPLLVACENGNTEIVKFLINSGANVNDCDNDKKTPLNVVIAGGFTDVRELLLNKGAL
ncbi:ankyrin-1-like isoform X1 [Mytilus californianus]|nr:ankyrin-1-like isoform X1 [Mytilus californianus]